MAAGLRLPHLLVRPGHGPLRALLSLMIRQVRQQAEVLVVVEEATPSSIRGQGEQQRRFPLPARPASALQGQPEWQQRRFP